MSSGGGGSSAASKTINGISTGAAQGQQALTAGMPGQNLGQDYLQQAQKVAANQYNLGDPNQAYGQAAMAGANQGSAYGQQTAADIAGYARGLVPQAQQLQSYAPQLHDYGAQVAQMGFDPQSALYNRTLQQVQDQSRVAQAARGVATSPYGAGLEDQATRNFNIDWQNQLLNRATQGLGAAQGADTAAAGLDTSAAGLGSTAFNLGSGATDLAASSAKLPYQTQQGMFGDQANALSGLGNNVSALNQPRQQTIGDYFQAAGLGPAYSNAASQAQQAGTNQITGLAGIPLSLIGKH